MMNQVTEFHSEEENSPASDTRHYLEKKKCRSQLFLWNKVKFHYQLKRGTNCRELWSWRREQSGVAAPSGDTQEKYNEVIGTVAA